MSMFGDTPQDPRRNILTTNMYRDLNMMQRIELKSYWSNCMHRNKRKRHHKLLQKSQEKIEQELDLRKLIKRMRMQAVALMGLMTPS